MELWVADVDDGTTTRLLAADDAHDWTPTWSPDGQTIAFSSTRGHANPDDVIGCDLWLVDADGTNPRFLYDGGGQDEDPVYSPDSQTIYFMSTRASGPCDVQLWKIDVALGASSAQPILDDMGTPVCGEDPSASRDPAYLYYAGNTGDARNRFSRVNVITGQNTGFGGTIEPFVGRAGTQFVHVDWIDGIQGGGNLMISDIDGTFVQFVTASGRDFFPRW